MVSVCQRCKKAKATVHITDTAPKKRELHLCEDCAEQEGVIKKSHTTTNAILQEFIKQKMGASPVEDISCPKCGATFKEFQSRGLLGCANDYEVFNSVLMPLISRAHGGATHHVGKVPPTVDGDVRKQTGLLRLRRELQDAIEAENYELAARVRDQIRGLE